MVMRSRSSRAPSQRGVGDLEGGSGLGLGRRGETAPHLVDCLVARDRIGGLARCVGGARRR